MTEYCDTPQSKERRNREHKVCLNVGAILCLLNNLEQNAQRPPAKIAGELSKEFLCTKTATLVKTETYDLKTIVLTNQLTNESQK